MKEVENGETKGDYMELKEMCKEARNAMRLSQKEFARLVGATQTEISFIEGGFIPPKEEKIKAIIKFYECSVTHWMPLPEPPNMKGGE